MIINVMRESKYIPVQIQSITRNVILKDSGFQGTHIQSNSAKTLEMRNRIKTAIPYRFEEIPFKNYYENL